MAEIAQETQNILTDREIKLLHAEIMELRTELNALKADKDRAILWGVMALGAAVVGMAMWIFNLIATKTHL